MREEIKTSNKSTTEPDPSSASAAPKNSSSAPNDSSDHKGERDTSYYLPGTKGDILKHTKDKAAPVVSAVVTRSADVPKEKKQPEAVKEVSIFTRIANALNVRLPETAKDLTAKAQGTEPKQNEQVQNQEQDQLVANKKLGQDEGQEVEQKKLSDMHPDVLNLAKQESNVAARHNLMLDTQYVALAHLTPAGTPIQEIEKSGNGPALTA
jgi:hypothetical protein